MVTFFDVLSGGFNRIAEALLIFKTLFGFVCIVIAIVYLPKILINLLSSKLDRRGKPPIGRYFKEKRMDTVTVMFCESELEKHKDKKAERIKEEYSARMLVLGYSSEKEVTRNKNEAISSRRANEKLLLQFEKEVAAMLCGESPCLFDRYGYVRENVGEGEIKDLSRNADRSFYLGNDKKLEAWLESQEKVINEDGQLIGVRGIDENAVEQLLAMPGGKDFEISEFVIPDIDEETLCKMSLTQLLLFCDISNCKFKINNGTIPPRCHFEFSETPGYTGTEMCERIKALAQSKGYEFKIIE